MASLWVAVWRDLKTGLIPGCVAVLLIGYGVTSCTNLVEIYRTSENAWQDAVLWRLEAPLFAGLLGSFLDVPPLWDKVYFLYWSFILFGSAALLVSGRLHGFMTLSLGIVLAFAATRGIALLFPTQGPVFYQPERFHLEGTLSYQAQALLIRYMRGEVQQNGFLPGTMAMPSLHVGITAMVAWALGREWTWTWYITAPWFLLNWLSTIMLGWHYATDGIGGMAVAGVAVAIALHINRYDSAVTRVFEQKAGHMAMPSEGHIEPERMANPHTSDF